MHCIDILVEQEKQLTDIFKFLKVDTSRMNLELKIFTEKSNVAVSRSLFNGYALVQTKCEKFMATFGYTEMGIDDYLRSGYPL